MTTAEVPQSQPTALGRRTVETTAGFSGLLFLLLILLQNVLKQATNPANNASAADLIRFAHDQAWSVNLLVVTYIIGFPALFLFAAGLAAQAERFNPAAQIWGRLGRASVNVIAVLFGFVNIVQIVMVAARDALAGDPALTTTLWTLHNAVFTLNLVAVGGALLGLSRAAALAGLIPRPFGLACAGGALLLGVAAAPAVAEIHGSMLLGLGLIGFICWMVFLAWSSARLLSGK
ncbi:MAG TPA: hypothetical protein VFK80_03655 [Limnochordia bacterium]|nr:hypothetical protein [Limnochordia bacterium]